ncbi:MAG: hypothetical protein RLY30_1752 [Pseudomonadota bacterium]|jgi:TrmH family RNA methyltransferase
MHELISSEQNPRFQLWKRLAVGSRDRRQSGLIWLEGQRLVEEGLLWLSCQPTTSSETALLIHPQEPSAWGGLLDRFSTLLSPCPEVYALDPKLWPRISQVEQPQGVALVMPRPGQSRPLETALSDRSPWRDWVVLDGLQDPGNVGSLLRAAVGAGLSGAVLLKGTTEAFSPKALRAGMGAQFQLQIWEGLGRAEWLEQSAQWGVLNALTLAPHGAQTVPLWRASELGQANRLAWVLGQEGDGLDSAWMAQPSALRLTIPQAAGLESLNVTTAAAVCFFERARLRWAALGG